MPRKPRTDAPVHKLFYLTAACLGRLADLAGWLGDGGRPLPRGRVVEIAVAAAHANLSAGRRPWTAAAVALAVRSGKLLPGGVGGDVHMRISGAAAAQLRDLTAIEPKVASEAAAVRAAVAALHAKEARRHAK